MRALLWITDFDYPPVKVPAAYPVLNTAPALRLTTRSSSPPPTPGPSWPRAPQELAVARRPLHAEKHLELRLELLLALVRARRFLRVARREARLLLLHSLSFVPGLKDSATAAPRETGRGRSGCHPGAISLHLEHAEALGHSRSPSSRRGRRRQKFKFAARHGHELQLTSRLSSRGFSLDDARGFGRSVLYNELRFSTTLRTQASSSYDALPGESTHSSSSRCRGASAAYRAVHGAQKW